MDMLKNFNPENGRMEQFRIKGAGVTLNLAKNPAGFNQNISAVMQDTNSERCDHCDQRQCAGWYGYFLAVGCGF